MLSLGARAALSSRVSRHRCASRSSATHPSDLKMSPELEASSAQAGRQGTLYLAQQALQEVGCG